MPTHQVTVHVIDIPELQEHFIKPLLDPSRPRYGWLPPADELAELRAELANNQGARQLVENALISQFHYVRLVDSWLTLRYWTAGPQPEDSLPRALHGSIPHVFAEACWKADLEMALELEGGFYIAAENVPAARAWLASAMARALERGVLADPRELLPITSALDRAAAAKLAYWEAPSILINDRENESTYGVPATYENLFFREPGYPAAFLPTTSPGPKTAIPAPDWVDENTGEVWEHVDVPGAARHVQRDADGVTIVVTDDFIYEVRGRDVVQLPALRASWAERIDGRVYAVPRDRVVPVELIDRAWCPPANPAFDADAAERRRRGVVATPTGYYALGSTGIVHVDRDHTNVRPIAPCATNRSKLAGGRDGALIVTLGPNRHGRLGFVRLADGRIIDVTPALCGLLDVSYLGYDAARDMLFADTVDRGMITYLSWTTLLRHITSLE